MRIKVKVFFDNITVKNKPILEYLIGCLAQREIGFNIKITTVKQHADIEIDIAFLETKDQAALAIPLFEKELFIIYTKKLPKFVPGQKKMRKNIRN